MLLKLLFECLSEEVPSKVQSLALVQIKSYIVSALNRSNIEFRLVEVFATARRITLFIKDIKVSNSSNRTKESSISNEIRRGVVNKCFLKERNKKDKIKIPTYKNSICLSNIQEFFKKLLEQMLENFSWLKTMRWDKRKERWIRPIKNILCILNDKVIPVSFAGVTGCSFTYGHRFLSRKAVLTIKTPEDYFTLLKKNRVILCPEKRKRFILHQISKFSRELNLQLLEENVHLLNELIWLIEWPIVLLGRINQKKVSGLPKEIVLNVINKQQKCLALSDRQGISHFATVVNVCNKKVVNGYERVLEIRLADAKFFISQDKKENLDYYVNKLDSILFHVSLGSVREKVKRIMALSKYLATHIPHASLIKVKRAAYLAKADLATSIIKEFPELQGIIGGYYAFHFQEDKEIVEAITEHYKPIFSKQEYPKSPITVTIAIADKVDSLVGLIAAGEKISGSYDELGLRRITIGIIRIILGNKLNIPIRLLISKSVSLYSKLLYAKNIEKFCQDKKSNREKVLEEVLMFFLERFKFLLRKNGINQDITSSVLQRNDIDDLLIAEEQIIILSQYLSSPKGEQILSTYKRVSSIITKAEKSDNVHYEASYNEEFVVCNEEKELLTSSITALKNIKHAVKSNCFSIALDTLSWFTLPVNQFMDNVRINCNSEKLRRNRLSLLVSIISIFRLVADFNLIRVK